MLLSMSQENATLWEVLVSEMRHMLRAPSLFDSYKWFQTQATASDYVHTITERCATHNVTQPGEQACSNAMSPIKDDKLQIFGTALISIQVGNNEWVPARALIDGGSMTYFITKQMASKVKLNLKEASAPIIGLFSEILLNATASVTIKSTTGEFQECLKKLVLPEFNYYHPFTRIDKDEMNIPPNVALTDPNWRTKFFGGSNSISWPN